MFVYSIEEQSAEVLDWFQELEEQRVFGKIKTQFKNKIVNIPNFILSKNYLSAPVYEPKYADFEWHKKYFYAQKHHIDLNPFDLEYPILFYDDFYDVSQTKICNKRAFDFVYNGSHVIENEKKNFDVQDKLVIERAIVPLPDVSGCSQLGCIFVAGYSHYHSMHLWFQLQLNQEVYLVIEPDNKFDKHAIAVYTDLQNDWEFNEPAQKEKIGYVPKTDAQRLWQLLGKSSKIIGVIKTLSDEQLQKNNYNRAIQIELFLE